MSTSQILVAGLSPTWQRVMVFDRWELGAVNRARDVHECVSGKVINVAGALAQLGQVASLLTVVGVEDREEFLADYQRGFGRAAATEALFIGAPGRTRTCTTVLDRSTGQVTELVEGARPIDAAGILAFRTEFGAIIQKKTVLVLTGSIPSGVPSDFFRLLVQSADRADLTCLLDLRGPELLQFLPLRPRVVKPNREELQATVGRSLITEADVLAAMHELNGHGAEWVVVSNGPQTVLATHDSHDFRWTPPARIVVNPIGSGDCLTAGIAAGLSLGCSMPDAIAQGIAAAAENVTSLLPARWRSPDET